MDICNVLTFFRDDDCSTQKVPEGHADPLAGQPLQNPDGISNRI